MHKTADSRNKEITELKLSIGQCKLIERLIEEKLFEIETGTSDLNENAFKTLYDVFNEAIKETAEEKAINDPIRAEKFAAWARGDLRNEAAHG